MSIHLEHNMAAQRQQSCTLLTVLKACIIRTCIQLCISIILCRSELPWLPLLPL